MGLFRCYSACSIDREIILQSRLTNEASELATPPKKQQRAVHSADDHYGYLSTLFLDFFWNFLEFFLEFFGMSFELVLAGKS